MITNVSLITIYVNDQDAAKDFYVNTLGFEPRDDVSMGDGFRWVTISHPNQPELEFTLMVPGPPLDEEPIEVNLFRGVSPDDDRQRVFGGQVAGQALVAAGRTVERGRVHSLHAYFLRPGDPPVPIVYEVDRIRDGGSFTTRRVVAIQHGQAIFNLSASFHVDEPGPEHQLPMPDVPDPDSLA